MRTFFGDEDYEAYLSLAAEWCGRHGVEIWAYCLMPNHVHMIVVPPTLEALCRAVGEAHRRYTRRINFRKGWRGHLWQDRFSGQTRRGLAVEQCSRARGPSSQEHRRDGLACRDDGWLGVQLARVSRGRR